MATQPETTESKLSQDIANSSVYKIGDWFLNANSNQLTRNGVSVELEYRLTILLVFLLENRDRVLTKDEILKAVWPKKVVNDDSVAVAISQLRKALEDNPRTPTFIKTIPGVGYQFIYQDLVKHTSAPDTPITPEPQIHRHPKRAYLAFAALLICLGGLAGYKKIVAIPESENISKSSNLSTQDPGLMTLTANLAVSNNPDELRKAVKLLRQFIEKNPGYAQAYLSLAETKIKLLGDRFTETENYVELTALLRKALELDPKLARAHSWLGELIFVHDLSPTEAEKHLKLAVKLAPNDDFIRYRYAHFLYIYKRFSEAREQINISRNLNP